MLFETLVSKQKQEEIRVRLGFKNCFTVDSIGRSGGINVLWRKTGLCSIVNFSTNFISLDIMDGDLGAWCLTAFYECPGRFMRRQSWNMLRSLHATITTLWVCMGDFNDLLCQKDKKRLNEHSEWCILGF